MDKGLGVVNSGNAGSNGSSNGSFSGELVPEENFLGICSRELLARGGELLKRTRKGKTFWLLILDYLNLIRKSKSFGILSVINKLLNTRKF